MTTTPATSRALAWALPGLAFVVSVLMPAAHALDPVRLAAGEFQRHDFTSPGGELIVELECRLVGAGWELAGAESVVIALGLDGEARADFLVLRSPQRGAVFLGEVAGGRHSLELRFDAMRSPALDAELWIDSIDVRASDDSLIRHAPLIRSRSALTRDKAMARNDALLLIEGEESARGGGGRKLRYTGVWSNEDGGTGWQPPLLLAHWGRTCDIEWVLEVDLDAEGDVVDRRIQAEGHRAHSFLGPCRGTHALLEVATDNNTFAPATVDRRDGLIHALVPVRRRSAGGARERIVDEHPWIYAVANAEMAREALLGIAATGLRKHESPADPQTPALSDLRNYLVVELETQGDARLELALRVGQEWFAADHGRRVLGYRRQGWGRTAIELPAGTTPAMVTALRVTARELEPAGAVRISTLRGFMFDGLLCPTADRFHVVETFGLDSLSPSRTFELPAPQTPAHTQEY